MTTGWLVLVKARVKGGGVGGESHSGRSRSEGGRGGVPLAVGEALEPERAGAGAAGGGRGGRAGGEGGGRVGVGVGEGRRGSPAARAPEARARRTAHPQHRLPSAEPALAACGGGGGGGGDVVGMKRAACADAGGCAGRWARARVRGQVLAWRVLRREARSRARPCRYKPPCAPSCACACTTPCCCPLPTPRAAAPTPRGRAAAPEPRSAAGGARAAVAGHEMLAERGRAAGRERRTGAPGTHRPRD